MRPGVGIPHQLRCYMTHKKIVKIISIPGEELFSAMAVGCTATKLVKTMSFFLGFVTQPHSCTSVKLYGHATELRNKNEKRCIIA